ncbi:Crp/Fnr family transcriptional regulator [Brachymonas sp. G13]|uniref:Crp/Fnr family transcriptional regulator n=1 Tax=Brachymonas TaxID=28219 RepID=UPI002E75F8A2|nr:Crp/Fnr family transcriptional regulator [Brachymonas sp. J145]MEE1653353.1 Crp/Fnr family transcriptional regulator [Brachymonas sp. J145]
MYAPSSAPSVASTASSVPPLLERHRFATHEELQDITWWRLLEPEHQLRVAQDMRVGQAHAGELVCRTGRAPTYWFGLLEGLLKMSNDGSQGQTITFSGLAPGGWFGEGTLIKREPYRYNIQALRNSTVAVLPIETFHWLLDHSIAFNRFIMRQLNERLGQFIAAREVERLDSPDVRVARNLAALFNPVLFPTVADKMLRITQQELAYLVGLSRQRVNEALRVLAAHGAIRVGYGGLLVSDLELLRRGTFEAE